MRFPTPHGDKLRALVQNEKLPLRDRERIRETIGEYDAWIRDMELAAGAGDELVEPLVATVNRYKTAIDLHLVFDSEDDFLYRQKGQLKLDNTVLEEFLPWLVGRVHSDVVSENDLLVGPINGFAQLRFDGDVQGSLPAGGMAVRSKDHDFALARSLFIRASHKDTFEEAVEKQTHLAYIAAEIKTNLDKTMFQEANATARDLKLALPGSRYLLLCEWLDMTPISTAASAIEETIVLRKAKRLSANVRGDFSTREGRCRNRAVFERYLSENPLAPDAFRRFL